MMFQPQTRRVTVNLNLKNRLIKIITFLTIILLKIIATLLRIRSEKRFVGQKISNRILTIQNEYYQKG